MLIMKPVLAVEALDHEIVYFFGVVRLTTDAVDVEEGAIVYIFFVLVRLPGTLRNFIVL